MVTILCSKFLIWVGPARNYSPTPLFVKGLCPAVGRTLKPISSLNENCAFLTSALCFSRGRAMSNAQTLVSIVFVIIALKVCFLSIIKYNQNYSQNLIRKKILFCIVTVLVSTWDMYIGCMMTIIWICSVNSFNRNHP